MTVIIFIVILCVLIIAHEWGHFFVAKRSRIRVDEFGIGFPPRAKKMFHYKGTDYTLNWIPFGGFVKIFGENYDKDPLPGEEVPQDSFVAKPKYIQALVLVAGVVMNFILGWFLISITLMSGVSASEGGIDAKYFDTPPALTVLSVLPHSPAADAGLLPGDTILSISDSAETLETPTSETLISFVQTHEGTPLDLSLERKGEMMDVSVIPAQGVTGDSPAIGISMDMIGEAKLPFFGALREGFLSAWFMVKEITKGIIGLFTGATSLSTITGPVGLAGVVGDAAKIGFTSLLSLTALISLNLAVINLVPFPALDGGRLLFVGVEAVTKKRIPAKVFVWANTIGFFLLIGLMLLVTVRDVIHLF